jgi:hypothetical protein
MADDNADILRRSLDAVDTHRKRLMLAFGALVLLLLAVFFWGAHQVGVSNRDAILAHFAMLLITVIGSAVVVVIQITVMTKRILRAIELATRK